MREIRNVIERYCPEADRNVAFEVEICECGRIIERCLNCENCTGKEEFCIRNRRGTFR